MHAGKIAGRFRARADFCRMRGRARPQHDPRPRARANTMRRKRSAPRTRTQDCDLVHPRRFALGARCVTALGCRTRRSEAEDLRDAQEPDLPIAMPRTFHPAPASPSWSATSQVPASSAERSARRRNTIGALSRGRHDVRLRCAHDDHSFFRERLVRDPADRAAHVRTFVQPSTAGERLQRHVAAADEKRRRAPHGASYRSIGRALAVARKSWPPSPSGRRRQRGAREDQKAQRDAHRSVNAQLQHRALPAAPGFAMRSCC